MAESKEQQLKALASQAIAGSEAAYAALLREVAHKAQRFIAARLAKPADADDIVQEILISVHKALPTYDPDRPFSSWLASIMHYRFKDYLRKYYSHKTTAHICVDDVQECLLADVTDSEPEGEYVDEALQQLDGKQKAVIHAMYKEELSVKETSEKLKMSLSAVKVTAHRAYKKLKGDAA